MNHIEFVRALGGKVRERMRWVVRGTGRGVVALLGDRIMNPFAFKRGPFSLAVFGAMRWDCRVPSPHLLHD